MENNMNMEKRSGYANYLNLSDKSGTRLKCNFTAYQEFKIIKEVDENLIQKVSTFDVYDGENIVLVISRIFLAFLLGALKPTIEGTYDVYFLLTEKYLMRNT